MNNLRWNNWEEIKRIQRDLKNNHSIIINGLADAQRHHLVYSLICETGSKAVYIAANDLQARNALHNLQMLFTDGVIYLPFREKMLYDVEARSREQAFKRIECLYRLLTGDFTVLVLSCESLLDLYMPPEQFKTHTLSLKTGDTVNLQQIQSNLVEMGYEREEVVEGPGQFALRGGILDLFPIQLDSPVRIELFDIEIDSIRIFDTDTQRSFESIDKVEILPAQEYILTKEQAHEAAVRVQQELEQFLLKLRDRDFAEIYNKNFGVYIEQLKDSRHFAGIDKFIAYFYRDRISIFRYFPPGIAIFMEDISRLIQRMSNLLEDHYKQCEILTEKGMLLPGTYSMYFSADDISGFLRNYQLICLNSLDEERSLTDANKKYFLQGKNIDSYNGQIENLKKDIHKWLAQGYQITVMAASEQRKSGLYRTLFDDNIRVYTKYPDADFPCVVIITGQLGSGFIYPQIKWVVVSESDISSRKRDKVSPQFKKSRKIDAFTDLKPGDYVVHQTHGIGLYKGIESLSVEGVKREYLKIEYRDGGFLYIPTTQMDLIQKYLGTEGRNPKLNKLGGTEWKKEKKRVKESLRELAMDLIRIEAERASKKGFAFSPDTVWQKQFEESFPYEETKDQLQCTEEIKKDMESNRIMDRLLCGDVGYGKTEVALRAVFKAAMDGKQSAFLVPTTVLASQHYETFKNRFGSFPITVDMLSRFRTKSEQRRIIKDLKTGRIDVIIGTHKLLNREIRFKDLGLLVIDEEQRFGVQQKEKIKALYPMVDILTLTATPIPRTLHMSLAGIRDISTIEQPPEHRYPVQTYVLEYREDVIEDAILREIARGGQVFYLFNRVKGIQSRASRLQELLPQARVGYAHGQMSERQLEKVMLSFINKEFDVLVCTTIIESGIDMPNVNTIIVEDADRLGLAQLYQLRGRVGRSNTVAYAYLTYRKDKVLNEIAEKRLKAIREFTEFGSGFKIAMRDLQLRGAGNLLGPEQHGHIESVGYDTYVKLLEETIRELKGQPVPEEENEVTVEFRLDAYLDAEYIRDEKTRLDMYKAIAAVESIHDVQEIYDELIDRYGNIPEPASNLIEIALVKRMAGRCGFNTIKQKDDTVLLYFRDKVPLPLSVLSAIIREENGRLMFSAGKTPYLSYKTKGLIRKDVLTNVKILLQRIEKLQLQE